MQNSPKDFRKKVFGRNAENDVCKYLKKRGYRLIARNFVTPFGEADVVAESPDGYVCLVEVKARSTEAWGMPAEAVDAKKRQRYRRIAEYYCMLQKREVPIRYDIASVTPNGMEYFENAYE